MTDSSISRVHRPAAASGVPDAALETVNHLWTVARALTNTAHDVNNALQVISGSVELLEGRDLDPLIRRRLDAIRAEAAKAATAVNRLLTYTRARVAPIRPVDLHAVAQNVLAMRLASAGRRRIQMSLDGAAASAVANAEETRVAHAVFNLLLAAEDSVTGKRDACVVVGVSRRDDRSALTVAARSSGTDAVAPLSDERPAEALLFTAGSELWTAAFLAESQGGTLAVDRSDHELLLTLSLPGV